MSLTDLKLKLIRDPEFVKEYYKVDLALEIGNMITEARIIKGLTQEQLAERIASKQSSIARAEAGTSLPSLSFLVKIATALDTELLPPTFVSMSSRVAPKSAAASIPTMYFNNNSINFGSSSVNAKYSAAFLEVETYA